MVGTYLKKTPSTKRDNMKKTEIYSRHDKIHVMVEKNDEKNPQNPITFTQSHKHVTELS